MGAIGYGGLGAARAVEHLRNIAVELEMVPVRGAVHIAGGDFMAVHPLGANGPIEDIEDHLLGGAKELLNDIVWWANAAKAAKA
jgi:NAD(P)H-dependent FMN reductase